MLLPLLASLTLNAQESLSPTDSNALLAAAKQYTGTQYEQYHRYARKQTGGQRRLLRRLERQERRMARKLKHSDSTLYARYQQLSGTDFDSLSRQLQDSALMARLGGQKTERALDSLRKVQQFVQQKTGQLVAIPGLEGLNERLQVQGYVDKQMRQRKDALNRLLASSSLKGPLARFNKTYGYGRQQLQYWKKITDDPDQAEEQALDWLQGIDGFNELLSPYQKGNTPGMGNNSALSAGDLERMGYQTRSSVNEALQKQFGDQLQAVQEQAAGQLQELSQQLGVAQQVKQAKQAVQTVRDARGQVRQGHDQLKKAGRSLKDGAKLLRNPMRGIPFWHRWEMQYNFQTMRASADRSRPALLQTGLNAAYRHSPRWSLGIGLDGSLGMGKDWQHLKLSYEGLTARVFLDAKLLWGISLQGGYEKSLKPLNRSYVQVQEAYGNASNVRTAMGLLQEAAYIGLMKTYQVGPGRQGTFLLGYNFLNDRTGVNSPWILRLGYKL